jgi:acetylornithine deacetylase/succinyl-diaminopimelate desuccinylase-like protein
VGRVALASITLICALLMAAPARAADDDRLFRDIYREPVEINTTQSAGDTHRAAEAMAAIFVANLIRYRAEGFVPERDLILALTTDEELSDSPDDGARFLVEKHRDLIDAAFALNEGGGGTLKDGKPVRMTIQLAEKVYLSFRLEVKDRGGHSAGPRPDQAINLLAAGLTRLASYNFPPHLNAVTRAYFERVAATEEPTVQAAIAALLAGSSDEAALAPLTRNISFNATMRTTCTPTLLAGGEAENALPQVARATINCRILPDQPTDEVAATLAHVLAEPRIAITPIGKPVLSPPSPLDPTVMHAVETVAGAMWPGVPLIPTMSGGYTDSRWLRAAGIPAYGLSGLFVEQDKTGVHGLNEQVPVKSLEDSRQFLYRLVKLLSAAPS